MGIADRVRKPGKFGLVAAGMLVLVMLVAACSGDDENNGDPTGLIGGLSASQVESLARTAGIVSGFGGSSSGIHASGVGVAVGSPDIAILSVGVESFGESVAVATSDAAIAMDGIRSALSAAGVDDADVETRFFNIQPEYQFQEISEGGIRRSERKLVGYRVTNSLTVTLRDLDGVGGVIDDVVTGGGDAVRLDNIRFTIEDGTALEEEARTLALRDAVAKADLYAAETGVERGKLVAITETSGTQFPMMARAESLQAFDGAAFAPVPTQISAGDLDVRVSVQAVFAIE